MISHLLCVAAGVILSAAVPKVYAWGQKAWASRSKITQEL